MCNGLGKHPQNRTGTGVDRRDEWSLSWRSNAGWKTMKSATVKSVREWGGGGGGGERDRWETRWPLCQGWRGPRCPAIGMTSWGQVRPVPQGAYTANNLPGCGVFFPRGSHLLAVSPTVPWREGAGGEGGVRVVPMSLPSSTSRAQRSDSALASAPKTTVLVGTALRRQAETQSARSWRFRPAWGREAAREVAGPRGAARPGDGTKGCAWLT